MYNFMKLNEYFLFLKKIIYLLLAELDLGFLIKIVDRGFLTVGFQLWRAGSGVAACGLSCPRGVFLDQGSNLWSVRWQVDS